MKRIMEILLRRHAKGEHYTDCTKGQHITNVRELGMIEEAFKVEKWSDGHLVNTLRKMLKPDEVKIFRGTWFDDYRPDLTYEQRQIAEGLVIEVLVKRKTIELEVKYGCLNYSRCVDCPEGIRLAAEEFLGYFNGEIK